MKSTVFVVKVKIYLFCIAAISSHIPVLKYDYRVRSLVQRRQSSESNIYVMTTISSLLRMCKIKEICTFNFKIFSRIFTC